MFYNEPYIPPTDPYERRGALAIAIQSRKEQEMLAQLRFLTLSGQAGSQKKSRTLARWFHAMIIAALH